MKHTWRERSHLAAVVLGVYGVLVLLLVGVVHATTTTLATTTTTTSSTTSSTTTTTLRMLDGARQTDGTLVTAQATTGASQTSVCTGVRSGTLGNETCRGGYYRSMVFTFCNSAGTATVDVEVNCAGAGWVPVANSSKSIGVGCDGASIILPQCAYRSNATACSSCGMTATYDAGQAVK